MIIVIVSATIPKLISEAANIAARRWWLLFPYLGLFASSSYNTDASEITLLPNVKNVYKISLYAYNQTAKFIVCKLLISIIATIKPIKIINFLRHTLMLACTE